MSGLALLKGELRAAALHLVAHGEAEAAASERGAAVLEGALATLRAEVAAAHLACSRPPASSVPATDPAPDTEPTPQPEAERGAPMVLLVEDEPLVATSTSRVLRAHGYDVTIARTARDACPLLSRERWEAVICDLVLLPGGCQGSAVAAEAIEAGVSLVVLWTGQDPRAAQLYELRDALAARAVEIAAGRRVPTAVVAREKGSTLAQDLAAIIGGRGGGTARKT